MAAPRKYPVQLRERAIRMTLDARKDPASRPGVCARRGDQLGINPEKLSGWVTQAEVDAGGRPETTTSDRSRTPARARSALPAPRSSTYAHGPVPHSPGQRVRRRGDVETNRRQQVAHGAWCPTLLPS
jgi:transposase